MYLIALHVTKCEELVLKSVVRQNACVNTEGTYYFKKKKRNSQTYIFKRFKSNWRNIDLLNGSGMWSPWSFQNQTLKPMPATLLGYLKTEEEIILYFRDQKASPSNLWLTSRQYYCSTVAGGGYLWKIHKTPVPVHGYPDLRRSPQEQRAHRNPAPPTGFCQTSDP